VYDLIEHPQLRTRDMTVNGATVKIPANPYITDWDTPAFPEIPRINAHGPLDAT
jgi:hypothetical protein